jgi:putative ABC transport system permease protein
MLKNYLTIALRYIVRHKVFTLINISGLTLGITCSLLIALYIQDELSYDRFHENADRIYRLTTRGILEGKRVQSSTVGFPAGPSMAAGCPDIESYLRLARWGTFPIRYEEKAFTEDYLLLSDPNFFRFWDFRLIAGHPDSVLNGPGKIVLSESAARRYFGYQGPHDTSPLGKTLVLAQGYLAKVTGIAEDPPLQSHFHYTHILSLSSWEDHTNKWTDTPVYTYFKVREGSDQAALQATIDSIYRRNLDEELRTVAQIDIDQFLEQGNKVTLLLQPLTRIHLYSALDGEMEQNGNIRNLYIFATIGFFIITLACINFTNLFTARAASRYKEIGVRKAAGAQNIRLMGQFLMESYIYVLAAVTLSLLLMFVLLGPFNYFAGKQLTLGVMGSPLFILCALVFIVFTGAVAGSYPAFYLVQFNPADALRGKLRAGVRSYGIRNALVMFQFFISTGLIIATLVVYHQLAYLRRVDVGFDKTNLVNLLHTKNLGDNAAAFKDELLQHPDIVSASYASRLPPNVDWQALVRPEGTTRDFLVNVYEVDHDHFQTMGYTLARGRFFSRELAYDTLAVILNETAARILNIEGVESVITYDTGPGIRMRNIIGIVRDFNFQSLRDSISPVAFLLGDIPGWEMAIRLTPGDTDRKIETIRSIFSQHSGGAPFEYSLVEENFRHESNSERKMGLLFTLLTCIAIFIACFGLLGLSAFSVEQRTKEIGIRKALGASVNQILALLNADFLRLVVIANLLSWPVAWWFMQRWLNEFAYRVSIEWWIFLVAGLLTVTIAVLSVSLQAFGAAAGKPVDSLRND